MSATFLIKEYHKGKDDIDVSVESNPFVRFITVFAALIHVSMLPCNKLYFLTTFCLPKRFSHFLTILVQQDVKHAGRPNAQLVKDNHSLCSVYKGSYLERQSIQIGLGIFIEDFPDLSTFVLQR